MATHLTKSFRTHFWVATHNLVTAALTQTTLRLRSNTKNSI